MTEPLDAKDGNIFSGGPSFSLANRMERAVFRIVWFCAASWTPPYARAWRRWLLRLFGAQIAPTAMIYGSAKIWLPRNLSIDEESVIGPGVQVYCMAPVVIGQKAIISQRAFLCCGSHDIQDENFQLITRRIEISDRAWICAEAFVGPGVFVDKGAVLAARAATFENLEPWSVYRGNPASQIKKRPRFN